MSAVNGIIDYSKARLQDATWWRYWRYMIQGLENQTDEKLIKLAFDFHLALISNSNLSADDFSKIQRESKELFKDYEGNLRPWLGRDREARHKDLSKDFKEQWKAAANFDPDDPVALARWENGLQEQLRTLEKEQEIAAKSEKDYNKNIKEKIEAIKRQRLNQQGRKP